MVELNDCGLDKREAAVMKDLMTAYEKFMALERQHPDEMREFVDGVHRIQGVLAMRVVRRVYPEGWPSYKAK